ncbi:MAG TPA: cell division protein SepF [Acidimicrobiales bacterium]|nr:cell division protein SepF [Acidimicrobiales bacterium]
MWRKAMLYLGLGPDEDYDDYDAPDVAPIPQTARPAAPSREPGPVARAGTATATVTRTRPPSPPPAPEPVDQSGVRPLPSPTGETSPKPRTVVRPVPAATTAKPFVVAPTMFNHAQDVADRFKASQPVIVNLQGADRDLTRRLLDFSAGLCYALGGQMEKVADQVFLLTPSNVEVSAEERRRLHERGLHDA